MNSDISDTTSGLSTIPDVARPTPNQLIDEARAMVPRLRDRGVRCEQLRNIPNETVADFKQAGFHRIMHPVAFGGLGYGMDVVAEIAMEIGRGCGSSAWMVCQWAVHNFIVSLFPLSAQQEYWNRSFDTLSSTASAQLAAQFDSAPGGTRISGKWRFSSGIDHADWIILMVEQGSFLVPKADYTIIDDWMVSGLSGSGSKTVVLDNIFVPAHRTMPMGDLISSKTYGAEHYDSPYYRLPFSIWSLSAVTPSIVGMGLGILELFEERVLKRTDVQTRAAAKERPGNQLRFAESAAEVDVARMLVRNVHRDLLRYDATGQQITIEERVRFRRDSAYASKLCLQSADRLFSAGDASAIYSGISMQRFVRDIHVAALHMSQTWDEPAIQYSRVRWGLEPQTGLF